MSNPQLKRGDKIDPSPFRLECLDRFGTFGLEVADELITKFAIQLTIHSCHFPVVSDWADTAELEALFQSEGLDTHYGRFFDQRCIDYLHRDFDDIDRINWRKFEGMTAEYCDRQGFRVDLGPGRNDGGVDVRVWPADGAVAGPPAILIQCKRQRQSVSKVVVKSFYADVLDANATSGLIVTTTKLSAGATDVCKIRQYLLRLAKRSTLRQSIADRKGRMQRQHLVDELFDRGVGGAKAEPAEDLADVHVRRNIDRVIVGERCRDLAVIERRKRIEETTIRNHRLHHHGQAA